RDDEMTNLIGIAIECLLKDGYSFRTLAGTREGDQQIRFSRQNEIIHICQQFSAGNGLDLATPLLMEKMAYGASNIVGRSGSCQNDGRGILGARCQTAAFQEVLNGAACGREPIECATPRFRLLVDFARRIAEASRLLFLLGPR